MRFATVIVGMLAAACAGKGAVSWDNEVKPVIEKSCAHCHSRTNLDTIITRTCAATLGDDIAELAPAKFPDEYLAKTATESDRTALFGGMCNEGQPMSEAKARVLYGLKNLKTLLAEPTPPEYISQDSFVAFVTLANEANYEGCEMLEFLEEGNAGAAKGMPPLWAEKLLSIIQESYTPPTNANRDVVRKYVEFLLPMGSGSCTGGEGGS